MTDTRALLARTATLATGFLESLKDRPVGGPVVQAVESQPSLIDAGG